MLNQVQGEGDYGDQLDAFLVNEAPSISQEHNETSSGDDFDVFVDYEENNDALGIRIDDFQNDIDMVPLPDDHTKTTSQPGRPMFFELVQEYTTGFL